MSNPLIRSNDPRFQRPPLRDGAGNNLFADPEAPVRAESADGGPIPAEVAVPAAVDPFTPPSAIEGSPSAYQPQYETTYPHRGVLLLVLAIVGLAGNAAILMALLGSVLGLVGLLAIIPAALAWLLGRQDLLAIRQGAIDASGLPQTRLAAWLGLAGVVIYALVLGAVLLLTVVLAIPFIQNG